MLRLTMLPASDGDALMLSWGETGAIRHGLVDMGRTRDYRTLGPRLAALGELELLAITHIDADHIEGVVPMMAEKPLAFSAHHVWFNAHAQLERANERLPQAGRVPLGAAPAEKVTAGLVRSGWRWNDHFASSIVSVDSPEASAPIWLAGDLKLILLSPTDAALAQLLPIWDQELAKAGLRTTDPVLVDEALAGGRVHLGELDVESLARTPFKADATKPNGASIAFVVEHSGKRVLMGADAHPGVLEQSLRKLGASPATPYRLDCMKVSHHGSKANTSPQLLKLIDCTCFAFSTDGTRHGHPDAEAIARILANDPTRKKTLVFNFRQDSTAQWENAALMEKWNYACAFPIGNTPGVAIELVVQHDRLLGVPREQHRLVRRERRA